MDGTDLLPDLYVMREEAERRGERIAAQMLRVEMLKRQLWVRMDRLEHLRPRPGDGAAARSAPAA